MKKRNLMLFSLFILLLFVVPMALGVKSNDLKHNHGHEHEDDDKPTIITTIIDNRTFIAYNYTIINYIDNRTIIKQTIYVYNETNYLVKTITIIVEKPIEIVKQPDLLETGQIALGIDFVLLGLAGLAYAGYKYVNRPRLPENFM